MNEMQRFYTAIIEKAKDGFGVFFPDLPGCTSFGRTVEDAAANAYTAAQAHVALSREYGDTIPNPRAPDAIPTERGVKEKARLLIPVELAGEPVRVNISLPATALEALDRTAKELSLSRSGAIAYLVMGREAASSTSHNRAGNRKPARK
jgi:predicted RNase H-like HicB family nuclease